MGQETLWRRCECDCCDSYLDVLEPPKKMTYKSLVFSFSAKKSLVFSSLSCSLWWSIASHDHIVTDQDSFAHLLEKSIPRPLMASFPHIFIDCIFGQMKPWFMFIKTGDPRHEKSEPRERPPRFDEPECSPYILSYIDNDIIKMSGRTNVSYRSILHASLA
jgi:hypothetical protein